MASYVDVNVLKQQDFADYSNMDVEYAIDHCPRADVVEVKHGEWIEGKFVKIGGLVKAFPSVECANCGSIFCDIINNHSYMYRYCPNCGAKMDGGNAE